MNKNIIKGIIAADPYIREAKNGDLTQLIIWSMNEPRRYVSALIRGKLALSVGDIVEVHGRLRKREFYDRGEYKMVTELVADRIKW